MGVGGRTVQSLELLPHSQEVVGSIHRLRGACIFVLLVRALSGYQLTSDSIFSLCVGPHDRQAVTSRSVTARVPL